MRFPFAAIGRILAGACAFGLLVGTAVAAESSSFILQGGSVEVAAPGLQSPGYRGEGTVDWKQTVLQSGTYRIVPTAQSGQRASIASDPPRSSAAADQGGGRRHDPPLDAPPASSAGAVSSSAQSFAGAVSSSAGSSRSPALSFSSAGARSSASRSGTSASVAPGAASSVAAHRGAPLPPGGITAGAAGTAGTASSASSDPSAGSASSASSIRSAPAESSAPADDPSAPGGSAPSGRDVLRNLLSAPRTRWQHVPLLALIALVVVTVWSVIRILRSQDPVRRRAVRGTPRSRFLASRRRVWLQVLLVVLALLLMALAVARVRASSIPLTHAYNGRLLSSTGAAITTPVRIRLSYWSNADRVTTDTNPDGSLNTGAATYLSWHEAHTVTPDADGYFTLEMGSQSALPAYATLPAGVTVYLQVEVRAAAAADTAYEVLDPAAADASVDRTPILSVPYASVAETLQRRGIGTGSGSIPVLGSGGVLPKSVVPGGTNGDAFTLDADGNAVGDVVLTFGQVLNKTLTYSQDDSRFEFNDDLHVQGDLTVSGTVNGVDLSQITVSPLSVSAGAGLSVRVASGSYRLSGTLTRFAGSGSVVLQDNATTYLFFTSAGLGRDPSSFPADRSFIPLARVVTAGGGVTAVEDLRALQSDDREAAGSAVLHPLYEGAALQADGSDNVGQLSLTHDNLSERNFYQWTSTRPTLQDYDVLVRYTLPDSFVRWDEAVTLEYRSTSAAAADNKLDVQIYDTNGVPVTLSGSALNLVGTGWNAARLEFTGSPTWTPGEEILLRLKLSSRNEAQMQLGDLRLHYVDLK